MSFKIGSDSLPLKIVMSGTPKSNPSAPVSLLRVLSRSEDEATRKNVILNPFTPYDVLSELENQFTELFVNNPALESYNSMKL